MKAIFHSIPFLSVILEAVNQSLQLYMTDMCNRQGFQSSNFEIPQTIQPTKH